MRRDKERGIKRKREKCSWKGRTQRTHILISDKVATDDTIQFIMI
jgi:hypothetical protein